MKKIVLIVIIILIIVIVVFWIWGKGQKNEFACEADSDCGFYYTKWGKDNPCFPCWHISDDVVCMNKEKIQEKMDRIIEEEFEGRPGNVPLCTPCIDTDWDSYSCECTDNKCTKLVK